MTYEGTEFSLKESFVEKYKRRKVNWGPLGEFVFYRTYSRTLSNGKLESWWQTVKRVVEGCYLIQKRHCKWWNVLWSERQAQKSAQRMYDLIFNFKFLPPGRGLWIMGTPVLFEKGSAALNNCAFVGTEDMHHDFSDPFTWLMNMSMMGVGVGFDTEGAFNKEIFLKEPKKSKEVFVVEDSREGWVEAFRCILDAYVGKGYLPKQFDFSRVRPEGSEIKSFGGVAPGPGPLKKLLERTVNLLDEYVAEEYPIDSTAIVDLMNFAGAAVVAGGVRRSAEICLGKPDDEEYLSLKDEDTVNDSKLARWASNNSILAYEGMDYTEVSRRAANNGEPGCVWLDNARAYGRIKDGKTYRDKRTVGVNPCGEQFLETKELCCLVETFPSLHKDLDEYKATLKFAYLYAKSVTLVPTHDPRTNAVMFRNRRIGLSQTGIVENINRIGFREHMRWCDEGYEEVRKWDDVYSEWLCVPRSIKVTTVKPSGTVSLLPGVTPGIHLPHSEYYIRRVRVSKGSDVWKKYKEAGYTVEDDAYADQTKVIEFPVNEKNFFKGKDEVSLWEQLELAAQMQYWWSDNSVSITVTIKPEEAEDLARALSMYETRLKSVSFLPLRGDQVYKQAPYESITKEEFEKRIAKLKPVSKVDDYDKVEEKFCDGQTCEL